MVEERLAALVTQSHCHTVTQSHLSHSHTTVAPLPCCPTMQVVDEKFWKMVDARLAALSHSHTDTLPHCPTMQVVDEKSWKMVEAHLATLPKTIRHLVLLATVPVIYPQIEAMEASLKYISGGWAECKAAAQTMASIQAVQRVKGTYKRVEG